MEQHSRPSGPSGKPGTEPPVLATLVSARHEFLAFLERRIGDRSAAEDLLQDAFTKATRRLDQLRDQEAAVAWFYRILRNAVIDHRRRTGVAAKGLEVLSRELRESESPGEFHEAVCRCVTRLSESLKPEYADALQQIEVEGTAVKDYAEQRGLTASNAGVRVHRARKALLDLVIRTCRSCADQACRDCDCAGG